MPLIHRLAATLFRTWFSLGLVLAIGVTAYGQGSVELKVDVDKVLRGRDIEFSMFKLPDSSCCDGCTKRCRYCCGIGSKTPEFSFDITKDIDIEVSLPAGTYLLVTSGSGSSAYAAGNLRFEELIFIRDETVTTLKVDIRFGQRSTPQRITFTVEDVKPKTKNMR